MGCVASSSSDVANEKTEEPLVEIERRLSRIEVAALGNEAVLPEPRASQCAKMNAPAEPELNKRLMRLESHLKLEAEDEEPVEKRLMRLETFIKTTYEEQQEEEETKKPVESVAEEDEEGEGEKK